MNNFTVKQEFIIQIDRKDFITFHGLLDVGHQIGIKEINVELIQSPKLDNDYTAICKAFVIAKNDDKFSDIGDANSNNCNKLISRHIIRMASTRAIARALRSMTNVGLCCYEELDMIIEDNKDIKKRPVKQKPIKDIINNNTENNSKDIKKGAVTGLSPDIRFENALSIFHDRYNLTKKQIFDYLEKKSDEIVEADVYKIGQLWQDLECKKITIVEILKRINDEKA